MPRIKETRQGENMVDALVPLDEDKGLESRLAEHFGRAPYLALVELDDGIKCKIIENPHGAGPTPAELAVRLGARCVIIKGGIGARALRILREHGVKVYVTARAILREAIEELRAGKLREYEGAGCGEGGGRGWHGAKVE